MSSSTSTQTASERIGPYEFTTEIGKGSFATVRKGFDTTRPRTSVAIKVVSRAILTDKLVANLEAEISILQSITHANVVELLDCIKRDDRIFLVMPFCPWGDLSMYIKSHGQLPSSPLPFYPTTDPIFEPSDLSASVCANSALMASQPDERTAIEVLWQDVRQFVHPEGGGLNRLVVRSFLYQLCSALEFMWAKHIVHRDIKPQNLLLQPADHAFLATGHPLGIPQIKVADFGFARHLPSTSLAETLCGTPLYMAPEILRHERYDAKADLWSVGAVTYEMVCGKPPFRAANHIELLRRIEKNDDRIRFPDERSDGSLARENIRRAEEGLTMVERAPPVDEDIKKVIRSLLKRHSVTRAGFDELFRSPVVASGSGPELARKLGRSIPAPAPAPPPEPKVEPKAEPKVVSRPDPKPLQAVVDNSRLEYVKNESSSDHTQLLSTTSNLTSTTSQSPAPPVSNPAPTLPPASPLPIPSTIAHEAETAYPPRRSTSKSPPPGAVPIPRRTSHVAPTVHPGTVPPKDHATQRMTSSSLFGTTPTLSKPVFVPTSLPVAGGISSSRPPKAAPARKTTIGFQPTTLLNNRTPAAPHAAAPEGPYQYHTCDSTTPIPSRTTRTVRNEVRSGLSSSSASPATTLNGADSPGRQSRDTGSLLDGEYAMVEARSAQTQPDYDSRTTTFPGTFHPSSAASAAASVAAAAFGRAPIRRLSQIRAPYFPRFSGKPASPSSPNPYAQPALLPDRTRKESRATTNVVSGLSTAKPQANSSRPSASRQSSTTSNRPSPQASAQYGPQSPQGIVITSSSASGTASGTASDTASGSATGTVSVTPTPTTQGTLPPTPTGLATSQARPLPIPRPAFALPAHARPASFHRRSSASFSSATQSFSPHLPHAPNSFAGGGGGFSPLPSTRSTIQRPQGQVGASAPAAAAYGVSPRTPHGSTGAGVSPATAGIGTGLVRGPSYSLSPNPSSYPPPPSGALSSSLTRAMSQASIRLFGIPSGVALRNAQAIMRGRTWRSQSMSGASIGMSTHSLLGATGTSPPPDASASALSLAGEPDQAERNMLGLMVDYFHKAHVLSELADSMFADHFDLPPVVPPSGPSSGPPGSRPQQGSSSTPSNPPEDWQSGPSSGRSNAVVPAAVPARSSSSLSLASASIAEPGTPGTTPSSTPFNSGALGISPTSTSPGTSAVDLEALAAECLLIYLRAAALIDRGLQTTRQFLDARQANGWTRPPCSDLMELSFALKSSFQTLFKRVEYARSKTGEGDDLHPTRNINDLILSKAMDVARAAATDEMNHGPQWDAQRCIDAYDAAETLLLSLLEPMGDEPGHAALSPATTAFVEKYVHSIDKRLDNLHSNFGRAS